MTAVDDIMALLDRLAGWSCLGSPGCSGPRRRAPSPLPGAAGTEAVRGIRAFLVLSMNGYWRGLAAGTRHGMAAGLG